jgi:iron complex transport system substrate-binding protein
LRVVLALLAALPLFAQPTRIVSTSPSITEMLYALGLGPKVVGVTAYCDYPAEARSKPHIGTFLQPDYERILALRPDLVLVIKNPAGVVDRLRSLGLRAEELDQDTVEGILKSIDAIGRMTGTGPRAAKLTAEIRESLQRVRRQAANRPRRSVLFLVGRAPGTLQNMVGAGPGTFLDELLTLAGGRNILASSPIPYPKVSLEQILASDPGVIIDMGDYAHGKAIDAERTRNELALWAPLTRLSAVRSRRLHAVTASYFVVPGPRMTLAAADFLRYLHPEAVR